MELNFKDLSDILNYFNKRVAILEHDKKVLERMYDTSNKGMYLLSITRCNTEIDFCKNKIKKMSKIELRIKY